MKRIVQRLCLLIALVIPASAEDRPTWAIIDAADRLIAKNALFLPSRDGFLKFPNGKLVHYELPSKKYIKDSSGWQVEILTRRWRKKEQNTWSTWLDARPQYSAWKMGVIHVDVLQSGVRAVWVDNSNFIGATPPIEAEVMRQLDTQAQRGAMSPAAIVDATTIHPVPLVERSINPLNRRLAVSRQSNATPGALPSGMSRVAASSTSAAAPVPRTAQNTAHSAFNIPPVPLSGQPSTPLNPAPVASPGSPGTLQVAKDAIVVKPFSNILPFIVVAVLVSSALPYAFKKSRHPSRRNKPGQPSHRGSSPQAFQYNRTTPTAHPADYLVSAPNPIDLIQRTDNLLTPAELAFFAALKPLIHPSYHLSAKVRLADLFNASQGSGQQTAFNKIVGKHIDFVVTDSASSRILCGIELDDNSHARPDRIERDRFVNEIFARNQLPLLRIPFSWSYYPVGLRAELVKVGLSVSGV